MGFGTDRVMLYDVEPWNNLGFGVPNFGDNVGTLNTAIAGLVDEIGKAQLFIMLSSDAMKWKPPSRNTIERIAKLINRVNTVLGGRARAMNELKLEPGHASPAPEIFNIHPVPYFPSDILRNRWLKEYNAYVMIALSNMMQHSDGNDTLNVTLEFAQEVWKWFREIKILMGTELLLLPKAVVEPDTFLFTDAHYQAYDPMAVVLNMESADTPSAIWGLPTEDDVRPLFIGIPANKIAPMLKQVPTTGDIDISGAISAGGTNVGNTMGSAGSTAARTSQGGNSIGAPAI